jgi:serine/threonine protein kinase
VPDLSEDFVDMIADMMEKDPARRIQSAAEVAERLEGWTKTGTEFVDQPLDRQAWTPPPPPHEPSQLRDSVDAIGQNSEALSASGNSLSDPAPPPPPSDWQPDRAVPAQRSHAWPIAIALAVTIIGFVVRGQLN